MKRVLCLFAALMIIISLAGAQENRGTIQGIVKDPQGGVVADATVVITNVDTNAPVAAKTNNTGHYSAPLLLPGNYSVTVTAAGFKKEIRAGIDLLSAEVRNVDFTLQIGAATEAVTVTAEAPLVDATHTDSGTTVDERTVRDLPVMTNVATSLIQFTAGVNSGFGAEQVLGPHSTQGGSDYNNATGIGGNVWTIDGAFSNGNGRNTSNLPSVGLVSEVKVVDNTFDGSFGHSTGLGISITTKSGTNQFHGDASENYWSQRWQGSGLWVKKQYYTNIASLMAKGDTAGAAAAAAKPIQASGHSNLYGVTATGPIWIPHIIDKRNKIFWTFSYTGEHDAKPETSNSYSHIVPTAANKTGNFTDMLNIKSDGLNYQLFDPFSVKVDTSRSGTHYIRQPLAGNVLPASYMAMGAPIYKNYIKYWPDPNNWFDPTLSLAAGSTDGQFVNTPYNWLFGSFSGRMDINATDKLRIFGRYTRNHFVEYRSDWTYFIVQGFNNSGANGTGVTRDDQNGVLDFVYTVTPRTMVHASGAVSNWVSWSSTLNYPFTIKPSEVGLPSYIDNYCGSWCYIPQMNVSGYSSNGIGGIPNPVYNRFYDYVGDVYYNLGNHQFRFGVDYRQQTRSSHAGQSDGSYTFGNTFFRQYEDAGPNGNYNPATLGLSWASFMTGLPTSIGSLTNNASYLVSNQMAAFFAQDTWRVAPKLTLTLSLRGEWENGAKEHHPDWISGWDPNASLPISAAAQAAYALNPIPELPASKFLVTGGPLYAGTAGAPDRAWPSQLVWLPRIGIGYQLNSKTVLRGGYGLFYDTLDVNAQVYGPNQTGYSVSTGTTVTTTNGVTWGSNGANCGGWCGLSNTNLVSPLTDPFPVRTTNGNTRFNVPVGNTYGIMGLLALGSNSWTIPPSEHPRMQRWRASIERQLTSHDVISLGFTSNWTDKINVSTNQSAMPSSYYFYNLARPINSAGATLSCAAGVTNANAGFCLEDTNLGGAVTNPFNIANLSSFQSSNPAVYSALTSVGTFSSSTITKSTLLRPYPISTYSTPNPIGKARLNMIDFSITHRFSHGLTAAFNYTYLHGRAGTSYEQGWAPNDPDRPQSLWWLPNNNAPSTFTATWVYDLPFGKGRHWVNNSKLLDVLAGGWIISGNYKWNQGTLIGMPNTFFYGDVNSIKASDPTYNNWFNTTGCVLTAAQAGPGDTVVPLGSPCTAGWEKRTGAQPGTYQARVMPLYVDGVRNPNYGVLSASLGRDFKFHVKDQTFTFQFRGDAINLENHTFPGGVNTGVTSGVGTFGAITSGGTVLNRFIQIQGHIRW